MRGLLLATRAPRFSADTLAVPQYGLQVVRVMSRVVPSLRSREMLDGALTQGTRRSAWLAWSATLCAGG